jgi:hypothetical protein
MIKMIKMSCRVFFACTVAFPLLSSCASTQTPRRATLMQALMALDTERQVLVTLRPAPPWVIEARTSTLAQDFDLQRVYGWPLMSIDVHCVIYTITDGREPSVVSEALAADPRVESAQPMNVFEVLGLAYNDPYYHLQENLQSIHMGEVHRWSTGKGIRVAVVDTGVDATHPDLRGRILRSERLVEMDAPPTDMHGTAVAGVIAATANNHIGIVGVAPDAEVMSLTACTGGSSHTPARCNTFSLLMALEVAITEQADVLNLSLAGPHDPLMERVIAAATDRGITVVAACDERLEEVSFPASLDDVIAVRSMDLDGRPRRHIHSGRSFELAAPGVDVLTTVPGGAYDFVTGSSFAAAHLSGVVALLKELRPDLSPAEIAALLRSTSKVSNGTTPNEDTKEVLNVCAALAKLTDQADICSPL